MSLLKKSAPAEFHVPSLAEADTEYGALQAKLTELQADASTTARDIQDLEADMRARPAPSVKAGVAALLGETVDPTLVGRSSRLADLRRRAADLEAAVEIIRRRLADRRGPASVAACKSVRAEYGRRVAAIVMALDAVQEARLYAEEILHGLEREDVQLSYLPPLRPMFLGDIRDGHLQRYASEAKEAGYV